MATADRRTILVTGNPGSGKTTLAAELRHRGHLAVDADDEVAAWVDGPDGRRWTWDRERLVGVLESGSPGRPTYLCGIAMNQRDLLDLFDQVFLLSLDPATQLDRLKISGDRDPSLWPPILDGLPVFEAEMHQVGATVLDARLPTSVLATQLIELTEPGPGSG